jgi:hypothetical protein
LEEVEMALVQICIQMGKIRQPLSCTEAITLMNDMIETTSTKQKLIEFHQRRRLGTDSFEKGKVTMGWWRGFLRRHKDKLVTKQGENFALNRSGSTTLPNIKQMYEVIYDEMVDACVAVSLQNLSSQISLGYLKIMRQKGSGWHSPLKLQNPNGFFLPMKVDSILHRKRWACWWSEMCC